MPLHERPDSYQASDAFLREHRQCRPGMETDAMPTRVLPKYRPLRQRWPNF
jgi:hypothetical protein